MSDASSQLFKQSYCLAASAAAATGDDGGFDL